MSRESQYRFWFASKAWKYSIVEGLRVGAIFLIVISSIRGFGWIFHTDQDFVDWIKSSITLGLLLALPGFLIFAVWARWEVWQNNQVKKKR